MKKVEASETRGGRGAVDQAGERGPRPGQTEPENPSQSIPCEIDNMTA